MPSKTFVILLKKLPDHFKIPSVVRQEKSEPDFRGILNLDSQTESPSDQNIWIRNPGSCNLLTLLLIKGVYPHILWEGVDYVHPNFICKTKEKVKIN